MSGRPEKPIAADAPPPVRKLAEELRKLRAATHLTYEQLSQRTNISASTLSRAVSGRTVPPANVVDRLAAATGASPAHRAELRRLHAAAASARATPKRHPRTDEGSDAERRPDDLDAIRDAFFREEALKALLQSLHAKAGMPSVREIAKGTGLPRSTVHRALKGQSTAGAEKVAHSLVAHLAPEDRDDWTTKVDSTFQDTTSPAEAPPLFRATSPGGRMDAERAFSEFTDSLRRLRNLIVHGQVEADAVFRVQVMALAALVEERLAPPADPRYPDPPADVEPVETWVPPKDWVIESYDEPSWFRGTHADEQASSRRGEA